MRSCVKVIEEMLEHIPEDKTELIEDLKWNKNDASYKAPEQNIQWIRTAETLERYIPKPKENWEFEVLSIFTTKPVSELKFYNTYCEKHNSCSIEWKCVKELEGQRRELIRKLVACVHHMFDSDTVVKSAVQNSAAKFIEEIEGKTFEEVLESVRK